MSDISKAINHLSKAIATRELAFFIEQYIPDEKKAPFSLAKSMLENREELVKECRHNCIEAIRNEEQTYSNFLKEFSCESIIEDITMPPSNIFCENCVNYMRARLNYLQVKEENEK